MIKMFTRWCWPDRTMELTMKRISIIVASLLLSGGLVSSINAGEPAVEAEQGYVPLYTGVSLEGWQVIGGESTYDASGDSIVGRAGPGQNTFLRTEKTYLRWIVKYIYCHNNRQPNEMGPPEIGEVLPYLATKRKVAASTQNQALSALLFLYREVLRLDVDLTVHAVHAWRPE